MMERLMGMHVLQIPLNVTRFSFKQADIFEGLTYLTFYNKKAIWDTFYTA